MAGKRGKTLTQAYHKNLAGGRPKATDKQATKTVYRKGVRDSASDAKLRSNAKANQKARKDRLMQEVKSGKPITKNRRSVYSKPRRK